MAGFSNRRQLRRERGACTARYREAFQSARGERKLMTNIVVLPDRHVAREGLWA